MLLNYKFFSLHEQHGSSVCFSFFFVSLISPNFIKNLTCFLNHNENIKKIQIKQSYMLLTWFYYLTLLKKKNKILKIFIFPIKKHTSTHLKAPIAHKTWSKEQFLFKYYLFRVTFKNSFTNDEKITTPTNGLLFVLLSKKYFPIFETNIFFLKNYKFFFLIEDFRYFNYYNFTKIN